MEDSLRTGSGTADETVAGAATPAADDAAAEEVADIRRVTYAGAAVNVLIAAVKFAGGFAFSSQALLADAVHSLSDLFTDAALVLGVRYWVAPSDEGHPYGHGKIQAAVTAFIGQNYGAGRFDRIKKVLLECLLTVTVIGVVMGLLARFFAPQLLGIYTTDPEVIRYGTIRLTLIASTYFLCGWMDVLCGCMRGLGYAVLPMIVSLVGACGFRILWIYTVFPLDPTIRMLYVSYPISWALTAVAHLVCFILCMRKVKSIWKRRITV